MKRLVPNLTPEDKALMEKLLATGNIMYNKYAIRLQTVLRRANGKAGRKKEEKSR
jgi:hypothetical protein